jgi:hypothetical protein
MKQSFKNVAISVILILFLTVVNGLSFADTVGAQALLGTAKNFAVLAYSTVTNTGPSVVTGHLGVSPGLAIVGFDEPGGPGSVIGTQYSAGAVPLQAQSDVTTAYNDLAGRSCPGANDLTGTDLGALTTPLTPGVYCFTSSAQLTGDLVLDAENDPDAVFIFQIMTETLTTASNSTVSMINGGSPCNVFWQVGSSATLGTYTQFIGNILAYANITLNTGANIAGRALARTEAVNMDTNNISILQCANPTSVGLISSVSGGSPVNMENIGPWLLLVLSFLGITWLVLRVRRSPIS